MKGTVLEESDDERLEAKAVVVDENSDEEYDYEYDNERDHSSPELGSYIN
eukprot:CAMPEP_0170507192 /NCGR_PEP_ID=MMETSP0208-20121228/57980_1 /TAXON_ID=197538 /ORGANISM="Strombidium inclinatum, Strain S3" /LENGTH=49 /DNA_ID=CAMNT_0010789229 /DNA_START=187 /DNA_END=336 /DNA_ORIENTATION=+